MSLNRPKSIDSTQSFDSLSKPLFTDEIFLSSDFSATSSYIRHKNTHRTNNESILTYISPKLRPNNINVTTRRPEKTEKGIYIDRQSIKISCFGGLTDFQFLSPTNEQFLFKFLLKKTQNLAPLCHDIHPVLNERKSCQSSTCPIKANWLTQIHIEGIEMKCMLALMQKIESCPIQVSQQIEKDVPRSFEQQFPKMKVLISKMYQQKRNMFDNLAKVLKTYALYDPALGYVQGMNLLCAAVLLHIKQFKQTFLYFKELMNFGKLRCLYLDDFRVAQDQCYRVFHTSIRLKHSSLYNQLIRGNASHHMFIPHYACLYAPFVDIRYMHMLIELFMRDGIGFLNRFLIALLIYLKDDLMVQEEEVVIKLGASYLKAKGIPWGDVLRVSQVVQE